MAKPQKKDRRQVAEELRKQQRRQERRRTFTIIGASSLVGLLIVGSAAYRPVKDWWDNREFAEIELASLGAPASTCGDIITRPGEGQNEHVPPDTDLSYDDAPPATGRHWQNWDGMERKFYTPEDRPELGLLVHNLEHGYTFLWYDETIAEDEDKLAEVRRIADKFEGTDNMRMKFKAVPWTSEDGDPFPDGNHVAFTHWSVGGADAEEPQQTGVWQYCDAPSGEALEQFMEEYPYLDSPEPMAG